MKSIYPRKVSDYPLYIFIYWVLIWAVLMLVMLLGIILSTTNNGRFVEKTDSPISKPYYVPIGEDIKDAFVSTGIKTGVIVILVGYSWMLLSWKRRKKK